MNPHDPRHGTNAGAAQHWKDGEKPCQPCATVARRASKGRRLDAHRGNPRRVPLGAEAHAVIAGLSRRQLAERTGLRSDKLSTLLRQGPEKVVARETRDKILAAAGSSWTPIGIQRRLQALSRLGWSMREVSARCGIDVDSLKRIRRGSTPTFVRFTVAEAVVAVYAELSFQIPERGASASETRTEAIRRGYAPPLAYDDIDDIHDEPSYSAEFTRWNSFDERFWGRVDQGADGGCWLWLGRLTEKGYGSRVGHNGDTFYPHQLSYILHVGPIPTGLVIDHLCRVRNCVNPEHLEPVTALENTQRGTAARWFEPCPNGHSPTHRKALPSGKNVCLECRRRSDRERDERARDSRRAAARARYSARQNFVDEAVVDRVLGGDFTLSATTAERREIVARWPGTLAELERQTGWRTARYISRDQEAS